MSAKPTLSKVIGSSGDASSPIALLRRLWPYIKPILWILVGAIVAMAVSGVFSLDFQTIESPQTRPSIAFQAQTATGKLNALITPTTPSG